MYGETSPKLRDAIKDFIWHRRGRYRYQFGKRDVETLAQTTDEPAEAVEQAFFAPVGDAWIGTVMRGNRGGGDLPAYAPMAPPSDWLDVAFDVPWMQRQGTLPTYQPGE